MGVGATGTSAGIAGSCGGDGADCALMPIPIFVLMPKGFLNEEDEDGFGCTA